MEIIREKLVLPNDGKKLLLHSCCAPCSGEVMEAISASGIEFTIFFYNPNIHPKKEYEIRKNENIRYAEKLGIPIIDADYDVDNWYERAKGMENEPERGKRCTIGRILIKSMIVGYVQWLPMRGLPIGLIIGEKKEALRVCWRLASVNISICRSIAVVLIHYVIPIAGA